MTVAFPQSPTLPQHQTILLALKSCRRAVRQTGSPRIASLVLPLPPLDPLAALLTFTNGQQRQCYLESPSRGQAIAAWDELVGQTFSGPDRFQLARDYLSSWQRRVDASPQTPEQPPLREGPYFFCSFSFFDTLADPTTGFAPATVMLTRWQVVQQQGRYWLIANALIEPHTVLAPLAKRIGDQAEQLRQKPVKRGWRESHHASPSYVQPKLSAFEAQQFQTQVNQTLQAIHAGHLQKRVAAHGLDITQPRRFLRSQILPRLRSRYPDCYVFSLSGTQPDTHFIGASPERLLSIRQGRLVTDALAGSAPRGDTVIADHLIGQQLLNTAKEQREHQLVLDFIVQQLQKQGLAPRYSTPPGLLRLSNIQHLHTPICADLPRDISPLTLVEALHPTPAVAGVPTTEACQLIRQSEPCDRGLYAAPLGWVDPQGNSEFIVGIRSALIQRDRARLYAGAGIVAGSDPAKELVEIQLKLQALAEALA